MRICSACGHENDDIFCFCLRCGAELPAGAASEPKPPVAPALKRPVVPAPKPPPAKRPPPAAKPAAEEPSAAPPEAAPADVPVPASEAELEADQAPAQKFCTNCGAPLPAGGRFCPQCGTTVQAKALAPEPAPPGPEPTEAEPAVAAPAPAPAEPEAPQLPTGEAIGYLIAIHSDGTEGEFHPLIDGETTIGREGCDLTFPDDEYLAPQHAQFYYSAGTLVVQDLGSEHGVYVCVAEAVVIEEGSQFRVGQQLLTVSLEARGDQWGEVRQLVSLTGEPATFLLRDDEVVISREEGHIVFPDDGYLSERHAVLFREGDEAFIQDLNSSNGTHVRIVKPTALTTGSLVAIGQHMFRVELRSHT